MKIFFITNLDTRLNGGLFNATYERLKRIRTIADYYVVNDNSYDSKIVSVIKSILRAKRLTMIEETSSYNNITINNLNYKRGFLYYLLRIFKFKSSNEGIVNLYIKKYYNYLIDADIIHAHWGWPNGYIAYRLGKSFGKPYFITFHGSDINKLSKHNVAQMLEAMENAEGCFFVSNQLLETAKSLGYSGNNSKVTYNGVDTETFKPNNKTFNNTVGYIGNLKMIKGADLLPQIFKEIYKYNIKTKFIIVGDGELRADIEKAISVLNLNVNFTGAIEPELIPQVLEMMDVIVVPSRNEGLGMVILEANAMGIPAVGSNTGGIPEAIGYAENIINIDDNLVPNMARRVNELLTSNTDNAVKYRDRVIERFSWDMVIKEELKKYNECLSGVLSLKKRGKTHQRYDTKEEGELN